jgi:hypothetical protein
MSDDAENDDLDAKPEDEGEVMEFMKDLESESKNMMKDLKEIDDILLSLKERVDGGRADRWEILKTIEQVRLKIGIVEKEDKREINEEEVAESLLGKVKKWVDMVV